METLHLVWWNLQNFFDTDDDPSSRDFHYTAAQGWTEALFKAKRDNLAAVLADLHAGKTDLLAVAEIEKDSLLQALIDRAGLDLKVAVDKSGTRDLRGIDVAIAYNPKKLRVVRKRSHNVHLRYPTRDIYSVEFAVKATGEHFTLMACHWPSRMQGKYRTEPLRIAVAEHIAYLVQDCVKFDPDSYEQLRAQDDIAAVRERWESKVMVIGDFNDEPYDRSVVDHLHAGVDLDRVIGATNDIDGFRKETADYRGQNVFLYNATAGLAGRSGVGTYFLDATRGGERFVNRYTVIDQLVASRGLLSGAGLRLDRTSVAILLDDRVATPSDRPRGFDRKSGKGCSDHLPLTARLLTGVH